MTHFHFTAKVVSFAKGQSAVHTAAYNAREQLFHERENRLTKDYGKRSEVLFSGIFASEGAPAWVYDRGQLWNRAEAAETRKNGQPARNVEFAIPHQLTQEQRERLVKDFVREAFVRRGMVADVSMHAPDKEGDPRNVHVHCLLTMRRLDGQEFSAKKTDAREWNNLAAEWRDKWARMGCKALERAGHDQEAERFRFGHLSKAAQLPHALAARDEQWVGWCQLEAEKHKGARSTAQERKGIKNERVVANDEIKERNDVAAELRRVEQELDAAKRELAAARRIEATEQAARRDQVAANQNPKPTPEPAPRRDEPKQEPTQKPLPPAFAKIREAREDGPHALAFEAALRARGMALARVDEREAAASIEASNKAEAAGKFRPVLKAGEIVAVNEYGDSYQLNARTLGQGPAEADAFVKTLERSGLPTIGAARDQIRASRQPPPFTPAAPQEPSRDTARMPSGFAIAGMSVSLADFATGILASLGGTPAPTFAQRMEARRRAIEAMESIAASWERGERLQAADIGHLGEDKLRELSQKGDSYLRELIDSHQKEAGRYLGRERER